MSIFSMSRRRAECASGARLPVTWMLTVVLAASFVGGCKLASEADREAGESSAEREAGSAGDDARRRAGPPEQTRVRPVGSPGPERMPLDLPRERNARDRGEVGDEMPTPHARVDRERARDLRDRALEAHGRDRDLRGLRAPDDGAPTLAGDLEALCALVRDSGGRLDAVGARDFIEEGRAAETLALLKQLNASGARARCTLIDEAAVEAGLGEDWSCPALCPVLPGQAALATVDALVRSTSPRRLTTLVDEMQPELLVVGVGDSVVVGDGLVDVALTRQRRFPAELERTKDGVIVPLSLVFRDALDRRPGVVLVALDARVPFATLSELLTTAYDAKPEAVELLVGRASSIDSAGGAMAPTDELSALNAIGIVERAVVGGPTMRIDTNGSVTFSLTHAEGPQRPELDCSPAPGLTICPADGTFDLGGVYLGAAALREAAPRHDAVLLVDVNPKLTWQEIVPVLDAVRVQRRVPDPAFDTPKPVAAAPVPADAAPAHDRPPSIDLGEAPVVTERDPVFGDRRPVALWGRIALLSARPPTAPTVGAGSDEIAPPKDEGGDNQ